MNLRKLPNPNKPPLFQRLRKLKLNRIVRNTGHQLASPCCLNCHHQLKIKFHEASLLLCSYCEQLHQTSLIHRQPNCLRCALPFKFSANVENKKQDKETYLSGLICADCQKSPFSFERCIAAAVFEGVPSQLVKHLKHHGKTSAAAYMAKQVCEAVAYRIPSSMVSASVDCLVPVPMHVHRERQRGFNQAELIANPISRTLSIPLETKACKRIHTTDAQQLLNRRERKNNLKNAFKIATSALAGKRVAIIDDVVTTGETANHLARGILQTGALHCEVWCYARTGKPEDT